VNNIISKPITYCKVRNWQLVSKSWWTPQNLGC